MTRDSVVVIVERAEADLEGLNIFEVQLVDIAAERRLGAYNSLRCHLENVPSVVQELVAAWVGYVNESEDE